MSLEQLTNRSGDDLWLEIQTPPFHFMSPFHGNEFATLLMVNDTSITPVEQNRLSDQLVRQGCRFAVCAGHDCSSWDDSIDHAFLATESNFNPSDDRRVLTTWHEHEPLGEILEFFRGYTAFGGFTPRHFLILLLGENSAIESELRRLIH
jgi:hypothetical protein